MTTHLRRHAVAAAALLSLSMFAANAFAQTPRPYQMSILASTDGGTIANVDIPTFTQGVFRYDPQPAGRWTIAWLPPNRNLGQYDIDWSRIAAVYVDEPYVQILKVQGNCAPPPPPTSPDDPPGRDPIVDMIDELAAMAAELRVRAPSARFWVNLSKTEFDLVRNPTSGCSFNQPYIDVISMDIYEEEFQPAISERYQYLYAHRASTYQQLALVAGTFTGGVHNQTGAQAASRLSDYLAYAAQMNQQCDLPLGPIGYTGIYDSCPVWMAAGWIGGVSPVPEGNHYYFPIDNQSSVVVLNAWQAAVAVPRVDPTRARQVRKLLPVLEQVITDP